METIRLFEDIKTEGLLGNVYSAVKKNRKINYTAFLILGLLMMLWHLVRYMINGADPTAGYIDPNIWLLILLGMICFLIVTGLCWWLLQRFWMSLGLPLLGDMVLQFKKMESWLQLGFYWLSFGLLLLAAIGCLSAIC